MSSCHLAYSCLFLGSTRKSEARSAWTSFCAWFMIWTITVSMLTISWNIDLLGVQQLHSSHRSHLTIFNRKSVTAFCLQTV